MLIVVLIELQRRFARKKISQWLRSEELNVARVLQDQINAAAKWSGVRCSFEAQAKYVVFIWKNSET